MLKVVGTGFIVKDASLRDTQNGNQYISFTVAINFEFGERAKQLEAEGQPTAMFVNCIGFNRRFINMVDYLKKGTKVSICGDLSYSKWGNNNEKESFSVNIDDLDIGKYADEENVSNNNTNNTNNDSLPWD